MNKKNLMSQVNPSIKHTTGNVPAELVELSDKDLQYVVGGCCCCCKKEEM
jgi:hypothetical protein